MGKAAASKFALGVLGVWFAVLLTNIVLWGGVIYVAIHFIRKVW